MPTRRVPFDGERREIDVKYWWSSRELFAKWDQIQVRLKGDYTIKGSYMQHDRKSITLYVGDAENLGSLPADLKVDAQGMLVLPRKQVLDIGRAKIPKSTTPKMQVVKDRQAASPGESAKEVEYRLKELLDRTGRTARPVRRPR